MTQAAAFNQESATFRSNVGDMFRRGVAGILLVAALTMVACTSKQKQVLGNDPETVLDHFLCYEIEQTEFAGPKGLSLKDQFSKEKFLPTTVDSRQYVCNPAGKTKGTDPDKIPQPHHSNTHLVLYSINHMDVTGQVSVTNQVDTKPQLLTLVQQRFLALPSGKQIIKDKGNPPKTPPDIPTNIDHFKCYTVDPKKAPAFNGTYQLRDQFVLTEIKKLIPRLLCNPVEKQVEGEPSRPMLHDFAHLVCYDISVASYSDTVRIANQFEPKGSVPLDIRGPVFLCVPSTKTIIKAPMTVAVPGMITP